ncbi:MAG: amino acid ABC transporter permease, partial [Beijerinckiaceae bacterium]
PLGCAGGLAFALLSRSPNLLLRWPMAIMVDVFRALPPLVVLIFVYSGLPFACVRLSPLAAVCIAFFFNTSSYYGEILRAGLDSIGTGQRDAAMALGLRRWQSMALVILPQAVRNVLPDLLSNTIEVVKLTSLASVVAFQEILYSAEMARSITFNASPLVLAGFIYLVLLWPFVRLLSRFERRIAA